MSAERELARVAIWFVNMAVAESKQMVRSAMREYEEPEEYREDASGDFISHLRWSRLSAAERLSRKTGALKKLQRMVDRIGHMALLHAVNDWDNMVAEVFGKHVDKELYQDEMKYLISSWIHQNVSLITSIQTAYLGTVEDIIRWGYETRQPKINIYRRLEKMVGLTRRHARFIACDQLGTLNSQITRHEHESAGISLYRWVTKHDSRVRDSHRAFDGKVFSWESPPDGWYITKKKGLVLTGRRCHPGEDYMCRCTAQPVFDLERSVKLLRSHFRGE